MKMQLSLIIVGILVMFSTCAKAKECVTFKSDDGEGCLSFNNIRVLHIGGKLEKNTCTGQSIPITINPEFKGYNDRGKLLEAGMKPGVPHWAVDGRCVILKDEKHVYRYQGSLLTHVPCPDDHCAASTCAFVDWITKWQWDLNNMQTVLYSDSGYSFGKMHVVALIVTISVTIFGCARLAFYCCRRTNRTGATTGANQSDTRAPNERLMEGTPEHEKP